MVVLLVFSEFCFEFSFGVLMVVLWCSSVFLWWFLLCYYGDLMVLLWCFYSVIIVLLRFYGAYGVLMVFSLSSYGVLWFLRCYYDRLIILFGFLMSSL